MVSGGNKMSKYEFMNFEKRDLTTAQKSHPSPYDFGETFPFNLIKQL